MDMEELEAEAKKLVDHIKRLKCSGKFQIKKKGPPSDGPAGEHIGAIIVDATLSARHNYKKQVEKRVKNLRGKYPQAATTSGFLDLMNSVTIEELLMGWERNSTKKSNQIQVRETAQFFAHKQPKPLETFVDLVDWIQKEENRRELKKRVNGVGNKTADYYDVLSGDPNAVAVDDRISRFLSEATIHTRKYKEKRAIVQLAAMKMGYRPLDLEYSIWHHKPERNLKGGEMATDGRVKIPSKIGKGCYFPLRKAKKFALIKGLDKDMEHIDNLKPIEEYQKGLPINTVRRGKTIKLFESRGVYEEFKDTAGWKGEENLGCAKYIKACREAASEYDELNKSMQEQRQLSVQLLPVQIAQLENIAKDFGVNDAPALARIWILERLWQLHKY